MKRIRVLLLPLSLIYWVITEVRNWFFEIGVLRVTKLTVPVISVGNISVGGTGKTPFVEVLVKKLQSKGRRPAVVSRGYGRKSKGYVLVASKGKTFVDAVQGGDEPLQLAGRLKNTCIVVDEDRVEGARRVLEETDSDCIVLDDGFQHRYLGRDLNIVLLTTNEIRENQWLLPAGNGREKVSSLKRADFIVISKCRDADDYHHAVGILAKIYRARIAGFRYRAVALRNVATGTCLDRRSADKLAVVVFSGLGDPDSFRQSVSKFGCAVVKSLEFRDHHWYSMDDLRMLQKELEANKAELLLTTQKDWMRLQSLNVDNENLFRALRIHVLEVVPEFIAGEETLDKSIERVIQ